MRSAYFVSTIRTESDPQELVLRAKTPFLSIISYDVAVHSSFGAFVARRNRAR